MEMHFIMCLSKPRLSYNGKSLAGAGGVGGALSKGLCSLCGSGQHVHPAFRQEEWIREEGIGTGSGSPLGGQLALPFLPPTSFLAPVVGRQALVTQLTAEGPAGAPALCGEGSLGCALHTVLQPDSPQ